MTIYHKSSCGFLEDEYQEMIKDAVNVKKLKLVNRLEDIASLELKLNFPVLGKRIPEKIKTLVQYDKQGKWKQVESAVIRVDDTGIQTQQIPASRAGMAERGLIFLRDESENYIIEKGEYELLLKANSEFFFVLDNNKGLLS